MTPESPGEAEHGGPFEGLRERKKRQMRQLISNTATQMFMERGFDDVRVTEVAERCGVSEKTVYNYFPTKESLVLDKEEEMADAIRAALGPGAPAGPPIQGALNVLQAEMDQLQPHWDGSPGSEAVFERFVALTESTPSLRAAHRDMVERLVQVAAEAMAERAGLSPDDPEPQIAATAILGLWRIQQQALRLFSGEARAFSEVRQEVTAEVSRAARLIDSGLWAFEVMVQGRGTREQMLAAAQAAQSAGRQVATALRQARDVWRQVQAEHNHGIHPPGEGRGWYHQGPRNPPHHDVEEWKQAQRELKQQYLKAKREQQKSLREALRNQQRDARRQGRGRPS